MAGGYDMRAYHDPRAKPVAEFCVSSSGSIEEFLPKLAEKAGLGGYLDKKSGGTFVYENGVIRVMKERN